MSIVLALILSICPIQHFSEKEGGGGVRLFGVCALFPTNMVVIFYEIDINLLFFFSVSPFFDSSPGKMSIVLFYLSAPVFEVPPEQRVCISGSSDCSIKVWSITTGKREKVRHAECPEFLTLPMLRLLLSEAQGCKNL